MVSTTTRFYRLLKQSSAILFGDISSAFDEVDRSKLFDDPKILQDYLEKDQRNLPHPPRHTFTYSNTPLQSHAYDITNIILIIMTVILVII